MGNLCTKSTLEDLLGASILHSASPADAGVTYSPSFGEGEAFSSSYN